MHMKYFFVYAYLSFCLFFLINPGPKPNTVADHWAMVWQENIHVIVMLTNIMDGMKVFRAFRLGRKDLLFFLCFIIFLFLDTLRSTILRKPEEALKICLHHLKDLLVQREK